MRRTPETIELGLVLNGQTARVRTRASARLLDLLRSDLRLTGAKEGCGTGECGTCTVIVNGLAVNSCLMMAYQVDGASVETVEGLEEEGRLSALQEMFLDRNAIQCGFCIPGMLLSAKAALDEGKKSPKIEEALSGHLCRCTGYKAIVDAVRRAAPTHPSPPPRPVIPGAAPSYYCPRSLEEALEILAQRGGETRPIAGGTDLLVAARAGGMDRGAFFDISKIEDLKGVDERDGELSVGAGCTFAEMELSPLVASGAPALASACASAGPREIRNRATVGGCLASASPLSDVLPALLVTDATVELISVSSRRKVPLGDFLDRSSASALSPDELIVRVLIPRRPDVRGAFRRVGLRRGPSRSKISVAVAMAFKEGRPGWVRVALGGIASRAVRATDAEKSLLEGGHDGLKAAREAVQRVVSSGDDIRSTESYRQEMAALLLERAVKQLAEA